MSDLSQGPVAAAASQEVLFFASLTEIESRPYFRADLPAKPKLVRLIGWYWLPDMVACRYCPYHRGHRRGFVAETENGDEIMVGNVCGGRHFPEFEILKREFNEARSRQVQMELVTRVISEQAQIYAKCEEMNTHPLGIEWLRRSIRNFEQALPEVTAELVRRARRKDAVVKRDRWLVGREAEAYKLAKGMRLREQKGKDDDTPERVLAEETIGHLIGLEIFAASIKQVYVDYLIEPLNQLRGVDVSTLSRRELKRWADWALSAASNIEEAKRLLGCGQEFFKAPNLNLIHQMGWDCAVERKLRDFRWDYARGRTI